MSTPTPAKKLSPQQVKAVREAEVLARRVLVLFADEANLAVGVIAAEAVAHALMRQVSPNDAAEIEEVGRVGVQLGERLARELEDSTQQCTCGVMDSQDHDFHPKLRAKASRAAKKALGDILKNP